MGQPELIDLIDLFNYLKTMPTLTANDGSIVVDFDDNDVLNGIDYTLWFRLNAESLMRDFQLSWLKQGYCPAVSLVMEDNAQR